MLPTFKTKTRLTSTLTSALVLGLLMSTSAQAENSVKKPGPQTQQGQQQQNVNRFDMFASRMQLNEKQKKDLKPMLDKLQSEREEALKKLDQKQQQELATVLNPEQSQQALMYLKRNERMGSGATMMRRDTHTGKGENRSPGTRDSGSKPPMKPEAPSKN